MHDADHADDFASLGRKLVGVVEALDDPKSKASGSDAASLARTRRTMGAGVDDLQADYDLLGEALSLSGGSGAAAVANERRMIRKALDSLREPEGVTKVAELASYRRARAEAAGAPTRRRKSG